MKLIKEFDEVDDFVVKATNKPKGILIQILIIWVIGVYSGNGQKSPYPDSPVIKGISLKWSTHQRGALGSDNFQLTWADDNNLYGAWGDGGGFVGNSNKACRVPLGVARIEGMGRNWKGYDVWGDPKCSENGATFNGKSWGTISVDGVLYMWVVSDHKYGHLKFVNLARSFDYGASWEKSEWKFEITDRLSIPTFINFGKDNSGSKDDFVYSYFIHVEDTTNTKFEMHEKGKLYLARANKDSLWEGRKAFKWFKNMNMGKPQWGTVWEKKPVFEDPEGVGWCLSAFYNLGLKRYILSAEHTETHQGIIGIFDAPEPWGPWTTVKYWTEEEYFGKSRPGDNLDWARNVFFIAFNNKWLSKNGKKFTLNFTGGGRGNDNDSFNTLKGSFVVD
ncbi:hypothetical protein [uncultured Kriegella sp.]|uniref:hypothetical protein n=1 Tax=uncultured Kriegella sp. TaxID=1798910 RepID=UPI0030DD9D1B|tara:strand:+ start:169898 stop:171067 length:1170 start_codon:yes stop_codon:yes gene_type:complete